MEQAAKKEDRVIPIAPPKSVAMIVKRSSIILDPSQKEQPPVIGGVVTGIEQIQDMISKNLGDLYVFPVMQGVVLTSIDDIKIFEKEMAINAFDINKLQEIVDSHIRLTFENFKELPTRDKEILAIKSIYKTLHDAEVSFDELNLKFTTIYKKDGSLDTMAPSNMYSLLIMYGVPVKPSDVEGITQFDMPYGAFVFKDGQPGFIAPKRK